MKMLRTVSLIAMLATAATATAAQHPISRAQVAEFEAAIEMGLSEVVPGPLLQYPKSAYLEGYGIVVTVELALERPRNPFSTPRPESEIRLASTQRHEKLKERGAELLSRHIGALDGLAADEKVSLVIHVLNMNPAVVRDLASQLVITATKQDALDLGSGAISATAFNERVSVREY